MLIIQLRRADLEREGACREGLALFDAIKAAQDDVRRATGRKPRRSLRVRWTLTHQLWMATAYPQFFGWLGDVGLLPRAHARSGANLGGANLVRANLDGANLVRANLYGANLVRANLVRANLYGANLVRAYLGGAYLVRAYLGGANLDGAYLVRANLDGANLRSANLGGARLDGATRLTTGETWDEYLRETLPALLTAGGRALAEVATAEHWDCHNWGNCPMHAAFGAADISGVPILLRPRAEQFIQFFDAKLIPLDAVLKSVDEVAS